MASYSVGAGKIGAYAKTLVASTVDTVTFTDDVISVEVGTTDGLAVIHYTTDGSTPTVGGDNTYIIPAAANAVRVVNENSTATQIQVVKLISAGTPTYWVARA